MKKAVRIQKSDEQLAEGKLSAMRRLVTWALEQVKRAKRKLRWNAHWFLPNHIPHPDRAAKTNQAEDDLHENEETRITPGHLRLEAVWGVELYGPTELDALCKSVDKLGWKMLGASTGHIPVSAWIREQTSMGEGSWLNIGRVLPKGDASKSFVVDNFAPLPHGVRSLLATVTQVTPSLTAVAVAFELDQSNSILYETEFNRNRVTRYARIKGARRRVATLTPGSQKRKGMESVRDHHRALVATWFRDHLPGFFSARENAGTAPSLELISAEFGLLLQHPSSTEPGWRRFLADYLRWDVWASPDWTGLELAVPNYRRDTTGQHIVAAVDRSAISEEMLLHYGSDMHAAILFRAHEYLRDNLRSAALIAYLQRQARDIALTREALKRARCARRSVKVTLDEIGKFFDRTLGSPSVARELRRMSEITSSCRLSDYEFNSPGWSSGDSPRRLSETLRFNVSRLAVRLCEEDSLIREHLEQMSAILSVRESVRAQAQTKLLTIAATLIALGSLLVALYPRPELTKLLNELWIFSTSAAHTLRAP